MNRSPGPGSAAPTPQAQSEEKQVERASTLRIVTWNCNMGLRLKFDRLLSLRPDIAIVQECADPTGANSWRPACAAYDWIGFNPDKGLGVFAFGALALARHPAYTDRYALYLPVTVTGALSFNLLGVWVANPRQAPQGATSEPLAALGYYRRFLATAPAVVAGDFNRLPQQLSARQEGRGSSVVELLRAAGLTNADTAMSVASGQAALRRTHFHQRKLTRGFVVDYIFVSLSAAVRLTAFEACEPHDWITWSDHVPLVAELSAAAHPPNIPQKQQAVL